MMKKIRCEDSGEIMLETVLIVPITIMILLAVLSLGFLYYQQSMMSTVANELAAKIGSGYKYTHQPLDDFTITQNALENTKMYRTTFSLMSIKTMNKDRAEEYLPERAGLTSLGINDNEATLDAFDIRVDNVGRLHVDVSISMKSDILFGDVLMFFGILREPPVFKAQGSAECIDITAYASQVKYLEYIKTVSEESGGNIITVINSVIRVVNSAKNIAKTFDK